MFDNRIKQIDKLKTEIDSCRPLKKELLNQLKEYYKVGLTYSSNAIEGNSLTLTETKIVLEDGITIGGKPLKDHFEAVGHAEAYDYLYGLTKSKEITEKNILKLHYLFYKHIDEEKAGKYRKTKVIITGTEFLPPAAGEVPGLMKEFYANIPEMRNKYHPVEFAAMLHKELVTIHPFVDGNGRTARLLMNLALLQDGYVITIIPPAIKNDYIFALQKAQLKGDTQQFINLISEMVHESEKDYLRLIH